MGAGICHKGVIPTLLVEFAASEGLAFAALAWF
jgi:hypothetical protein